jgi:predicted nuclease of restriction endonuclease-like (RecB) superfamily
VVELARYLARTQPGLKGFTRRNLFWMRQFFEAYAEGQIVSALLTQLPWTHHMTILSRSKMEEEREFYIRLAIREKWSSRELERQFNTGRFERTILKPIKLSPLMTELQPQAAEFFKDTYTLEFLGLPAEHSEADLEASLIRNLGRFITEMGRDFCFIGSQHPIQVGGQDFALDLLFYHRGMNCLVAIELKIREFRPADLGQLNFYLEALDRDHRKPHENPAVGILLCATRDEEVVEKGVVGQRGRRFQNPRGKRIRVACLPRSDPGRQLQPRPQEPTQSRHRPRRRGPPAARIRKAPRPDRRHPRPAEGATHGFVNPLNIAFFILQPSAFLLGALTL